VVLSIITFGIFSLFWRYATMVDGNGHFDDDVPLEDALLRAMGVETTLGGPPPAATLPPPAPPVG
jgi:hypothetical protein